MKFPSLVSFSLKLLGQLNHPNECARQIVRGQSLPSGIFFAKHSANHLSPVGICILQLNTSSDQTVQEYLSNMRLGKFGLMTVLITTVTGMQVEVSEENEAIVVKADDPLEVTVLHSASFDMSAIGASSVNLRLDKIKGQKQLQLVAR